eukprot:g18780.t1
MPEGKGRKGRRYHATGKGHAGHAHAAPSAGGSANAGAEAPSDGQRVRKEQQQLVEELTQLEKEELWTALLYATLQGYAGCDLLALRLVRVLERLGEIKALRSLVGSLRAEPLERAHKVLIEAVHAEVRVGNGDGAREIMQCILKRLPQQGPIYSEACRVERGCKGEGCVKRRLPLDRPFGSCRHTDSFLLKHNGLQNYKTMLELLQEKSQKYSENCAGASIFNRKCKRREAQIMEAFEFIARAPTDQKFMSQLNEEEKATVHAGFEPRLQTPTVPMVFTWRVGGRPRDRHSTEEKHKTEDKTLKSLVPSDAYEVIQVLVKKMKGDLEAAFDQVEKEGDEAEKLYGAHAVKEYAPSAIASICSELHWKIHFEVATACSRQGALPQCRQSIGRAALHCPKHLRWKVWLLAARAELWDGSADACRRLLAQARLDAPSRMQADG